MSARRRTQPQDPREMPLYSLSEVARFVGVPITTLQKWVHGRDYYAGGESRRSKPLIVPATRHHDTGHAILSFANLTEAHILDATRRLRIPMADVRAAIDAVKADDPTSRHPLITGNFLHVGKRIFVRHLERTVAMSKPIEGQPVLGDLLDAYLERIGRDAAQQPVRLFPMRRNESQSIMVDFFVASGQPVLRGTGIIAEFVVQRFKTGETPHDIADDYGIDERIVSEAIRYLVA
jgi:uncharacterized protein (DUF433 family)